MKCFAPAFGGILAAFMLGSQIGHAAPSTFSARDNSQASTDAAVKQADLGPIHILFQNDLSTNASTGALLLPQAVAPNSASQICQRLGESLFPFDESLQGGIGSDLVSQFDYLRYAGTIGWWDTFWLDGGDSNVVAYKASRGAVRSYGHSEKLGVLCTHTAKPTVVSRTNSYADQEEGSVEADKRVSVQAGDYTLTGFRDRRSWRFLGIPFADAPVGAKRFMHATAYTGDKILDATKYRNACVQATTPLGPTPLGEDCLNLNIYTPTLGSSGKNGLKPVLVAIYGGAFISGRNALHSYDGGNLASRSDIVVVMINYRLGALGWLASAQDLPGNAGLSDQILALKWVKRHIAAFGGDPDRITIGGQSAGAQSVSALLSSSHAKGLFRAAFMMSNPWIPWASRSVQTKYVTPAVAGSLGCPTSGKEMVECLQKVQDPANFVQGEPFTNATNAITVALSKAADSSLFLSSLEPFLPTPDDLLDDHIFYLAGNGTIPNRVPILVGTTSGEGTPFIYSELNETIPNSQAALDKTFTLLYDPEFIPQLDQSGFFKLDASNNDSVREVVSTAFMYNFFTCPTQRIVNTAQQTGQFPKVYLYETDSGYTNTEDVPAKCAAEATGVQVCHGDDLKNVFGSLNYEGLEVSREYLDFVSYTTDAFSAFVRSGTPNPSDAYLKARGRSYTYTHNVQRHNPWKAFREPLLQDSEQKTQYLSAPNGVTRGAVPHREACDFFVSNGKLTNQKLDNSL